MCKKKKWRNVYTSLFEQKKGVSRYFISKVSVNSDYKNFRITFIDFIPTIQKIICCIKWYSK